MRRLCTFAAMLCLVGCVDDLPTGATLDRPRLLGARIEVEADARRAWPQAAEAFQIRFATASPTAAAWSGVLTGCVLAPGTRGIPSCAGMPFALAGPSAPSEEVVFDLVAPAVTANPEASDLLLSGVLCANGSVSFTEGELPGCTGENPTTEIFTFIVPVATDSASNRHPSWDNVEFTLDLEPWPPVDEPPESACADLAPTPSVPHLTRQDVEDGDDLPTQIRFTVDGQDRETFQEVVFGEDGTFLEETTEELSIASVVSVGRPGRPQAIVFDEESENVVIGYEHPDIEEVPAEGVLVRFLFSIRDGRAGFDLTNRYACVVP